MKIIYPPTSWLQTSIQLAEPDRAEHVLTEVLWPQMWSAMEDGVLDGWFFIRKSPEWRLRYLPGRNVSPLRARTLLSDILTSRQAKPHIAEFAHQIYEPETVAFGGPAGMDVAHRFFHSDANFVAEYLTHARRHPGADKRREVSLLLCTALARTAGLEWYEQGDLWARLAAIRGADPTLSARPDMAADQARHLLAADIDASIARLDTGSATAAADALGQYRTAGRQLRQLTDDGRLERGLRDVLAHHVLFCWNRFGLRVTSQRDLARAARDAVFTGHRTASANRGTNAEGNECHD
ncbi:thiopeptide-type bacteriocin biosynthesis protein [Glycomyces sp. A-F 0318]|uniref:thiopeptide-type bacteriocin biosynthesis protein n=1 Tax=Glycomyces amatae TaxID=2881355 RepID=UPI001E5F1F5A|nr:thiopeptide-type bacteriocin biosynthesis protein [Glycomyces amatae]MCD0446278.1 thiopeptide-type bacteriocin biosynthesis protein [Glycomyces amatae]